MWSMISLFLALILPALANAQTAQPVKALNCNLANTILTGGQPAICKASGSVAVGTATTATTATTLTVGATIGANGNDIWVQTVDPRAGSLQVFRGTLAAPTGNNAAAPRHPAILGGGITAGENSNATGASGWGIAAGHFEIRHITDNTVCPTSGYCVAAALFTRGVMDVTDPDTQTAGASIHGIRVNTNVGGGSLYGILVDVNDNGLGGINSSGTFEVNAFTPNRTAGFTRGLMIGNNPWCGTTQPSPLCDPLKSDADYTNQNDRAISVSAFGTILYAYSSTDCSNGTAGTTVDCAPYLGLDFGDVIFKTTWLKLPAPSRKQFVVIPTSGEAYTGDDPDEIHLKNLSTINANATAPPTAITGVLWQAAQANSVASGFSAIGYGGATFFAGRRSGGTAASPAATPTAISIVGMRAYGYDTAWTTTAAGTFDIATVETWGSGAQGTQARIFTTPAGTATQAVALTITDQGAIRPKGFVFANIATVLPIDGDFDYCSDCAAGAAGVPAACAGAGNGAFAMRLNGGHRCWN